MSSKVMEKVEKIWSEQLSDLSITELCAMYEKSETHRKYVLNAIACKEVSTKELIEVNSLRRVVDAFSVEQLWQFVAQNRNVKHIALSIANNRFENILAEMDDLVEPKDNIKKKR
ncbi:MAG: hypothetical protein PHE54_02115 [Bacilli bacterium]|nr:hypothetical protein [Bacilli bacterium]